MTLEDALRIARKCDFNGVGRFNPLSVSENDLLAFARQVEAETIANCAKQVPTNWLDPLLTGPNAAFHHLPVPGPNLEALLRAVKLRILDLAPSACHEVATPGTNAGEKQ